MMKRLIARWIGRILIAATAITALTYLADSAIFYLRGNPTAQITVNHYMAVPLKGSKIEYDFQGAGPEGCSQSFFPQGGASPCWYIRRHTNQFQKL